MECGDQDAARGQGIQNQIVEMVGPGKEFGFSPKGDGKWF